ncbi:hypothetical protein LCGC14_0664090 [marine sediment metagenome]|uniref:Uncharacterized protein n=1 Tax=marine sediment metagenome TaxID=412755 RepID=A0A0F9QXU7_9ZZZZ
MPKFRKKPVIVDAEQFFVGKKPWPEGVGFVQKAGGLFVLVLDDIALPIQEGDWVKLISLSASPTYSSRLMKG